MATWMSNLKSMVAIFHKSLICWILFGDVGHTVLKFKLGRAGILFSFFELSGARLSFRLSSKCSKRHTLVISSGPWRVSVLVAELCFVWDGLLWWFTPPSEATVAPVYTPIGMDLWSWLLSPVLCCPLISDTWVYSSAQVSTVFMETLGCPVVRVLSSDLLMWPTQRMQSNAFAQLQKLPEN